MRAGLVAGATAGILALGAAGYFANEASACSSMKEDFLRSVDGYTASIEAGALAKSVGADVDQREQRELQEMSLRFQKMQLTAIYERCGDEAGRAAAALASDELRDSMQDVLSIP